jgi:hypothetical protein
MKGKMQDSLPKAVPASVVNRIEVLLCSCFTVREFWRFAAVFAERIREPELCNRLSGSSLGALAQDLVSASIRRKAVGELLDLVASERIGRREEVARLRATLGLSPSVSRIGGDPGESLSFHVPTSDSGEYTAGRHPRALVLSVGVAGGLVGLITAAVWMMSSGRIDDVDLVASTSQAEMSGHVASLSSDSRNSTASAIVDEPVCSNPVLHGTTLGPSVGFNLFLESAPQKSIQISFPHYMDMGEAARHVLLEHLFTGQEHNGVVISGLPIELCAGDRCFGRGTTFESLIAARGSIGTRTRVLPWNVQDGVLRPPAGNRPNPEPPQAGKPTRGDGAPFAGTPMITAPAQTGRPINPRLDRLGITVGGQKLAGGLEAARMDLATSVRCDSWTAVCGEMRVMPGDFARHEFTIRFDLLLLGAAPAAQAVEPYSGERWWAGEVPLLATVPGPADTCRGTELRVTAAQTLRWLVNDGAEVGPGDAWSVEASGPEAGLFDGAAHHVALVRRWIDVDEARLELWIDGTLEGAELSHVRADLGAHWTDAQGALDCPWRWSFDGEIRALEYWDLALPESRLETTQSSGG